MTEELVLSFLAEEQQHLKLRSRVVEELRTTFPLGYEEQVLIFLAGT
jgi:hypothetical protein